MVRPPVYLGVEGGATRSVALYADAHGRVLRRIETGPLNLKLAGDREILEVLRGLAKSQISNLKSQISALALCVAGCRTEADRNRLRRLARRVWPGARCFAGNDLESGFAAAFGTVRRGILIISGTGSCVYGRHGSRTTRVGGWGHWLGDHGSGYWIALGTLRSVLCRYDRTGRINRPLRNVLRRLRFSSPERLIDWIQSASKSDMAGLSAVLWGADRRVLAEAAEHLAGDCRAAAKTLRLASPPIVLSGGVFAHHPAFGRMVSRRIRHLLPGARIRSPQLESAHGALQLARESAPSGRG